MPDIFLSYKREDERTAAKLVGALRDIGFDVWWDSDIPIGAAWETTIERALTEARIVLVCWSRAAVASENVRSEARWAREQGRLIQLFVEPCEPPLFFGERQGIDISHWAGGASDARFQRLVTQMRERLIAAGDRATPADAPPPHLMPPAAASELGRWLAALDLDRFAGAFEAAEVNMATLPQLDDADLKEIGIPLGPRRRILAALADAPVAIAAEEPRAAAASEPPRANPAERRQVTVMSADLVDVARLSMELDPELLADLLARHQECLTRAIAAAGGRVVTSASGVLACFGWPEAREDAAECAIRCGLQVIAETGRIEGLAGRAPQSRIGIATGLVVVGGEADGPGGEVSVAGEAPNLAAALRQLAPPDTIAIAEATHRRVGRVFECEPLAETAVAGFAAPVPAWRPLREVPHLSRFRAAGVVKTSFVGRVHELSLLADRWRTVVDGNARTVVILAEAGMGKSRLVDALHNQIGEEPHEAITWQCSPYHRTKAFYPAIEYLTYAAGIVATDSPPEQLRKLGETLDGAGMPLDANLALFAQLLDIQPDAGFAPPALPPGQARAATITALGEWLQRIAAAKPLLFVLEDAHWIDATTLELLTRLVGSPGDVPLLTVITARPEFVSPWSGRAEVSTVGLDRLSNRDCEALAKEVTGASVLPGRTVSEIVARSDGNPLFVEELSVAVVETKASAAKAVPDSLQSSLMARLDRLGEAKQTAQVCSVLGRRFARPLLAQVAGLALALLDANLSLLVEHDVIRPIGGAGEGRYEFKHALVRDAAYESMLLSQRRRLHDACGRCLEQSFPDVARTEPELLAQHFSMAGAAREASAYAEQAGDRGTAAAAFHEAIDNYREALRQNDLLPAGVERDRAAIGLLLKLGPAVGMIDGLHDPAVGEIYRRAETLSRASGNGDALFKAVWGVWINANVACEHNTAAAAAERLVEIGKKSGDEDLALEAIHCRWSSAWFRGNYHACVADAERGASLYDRHRHHQLGHIFGGHDPGVCAFGCKGQATIVLGDVDGGLAAVNEAVILAGELDHPGSLAHGLMLGMVSTTIARTPDLLIPLAERTLELGRRFNLPPQQAMGGYHLAWVEAETGDREKGLEQMAALYDRVTAVGPITLLYKTMYIDQLFKAGRVTEALAIADRTTAELRFPDMGLLLPELFRLRGECLAATGQKDEAIAQMVHAEAMATRDGAGLFRLRAATSLCRDAGPSAKPVLAAALAALPGEWAGPEVVGARELLAG